MRVRSIKWKITTAHVSMLIEMEAEEGEFKVGGTVMNTGVLRSRTGTGPRSQVNEPA